MYLVQDIASWLTVILRAVEMENLAVKLHIGSIRTYASLLYGQGIRFSSIKNREDHGETVRCTCSAKYKILLRS